MQQMEPRLVGTRDIVIGVGEVLPDLKEGLGVNDAVERVEIDTSAVDTGTAGEYPIIYRYTDIEGTVHEIETTCTVTAGESLEPAGKKNIHKQKETKEQQEKNGQVQEKQKKTVQTTPPQTGDWAGFLGYAVLFLVSMFLFLLFFLRQYFFG